MNSEKQSTNLQMTLREVNRVGERQKNVPKIRFKGYEDAWEQRRLEEIFLKIRNAFVGTSTPYYVEKNQGGHFYIESNNVKHGQINHDTEVFINEEFYQNQKDKWLKTGDIVMVQSGHVGHSAVIPEYLNNSAAHALIMFQEYLIETNPNFINFQFQTESVRNKIDSITTGNTIKHILASDMKLFSISNTQKKEADKLGDFFISLDNLITLHQRKYDALKTMKKTLLSKMFPKDGEDVPEIRFKGFTDAWEQRKLGDIADKVTVKNSNLQYIETFTNSAEVGIISQRDYFDHDIANLSNLDGYYIVQKEDFVYNPRISTSAPVGPINRNKLGRVGVMSPLYTVFRTHNVDTTYLEYFFKSQYWHSFMKFHGDSGARSDRFSIKDAIFFKMPIPLPDIDEQQKIGDYLNSVDHLITLHQRKLDELKNMKKTLLQQMFV